MKTLLIIVCAYLLIVVGDAKAQVRNAKPVPTKDEPPLVPLTEAERALDFRNIVANQPDFVADEEFFYGEGRGGFSAKRHVARKGNRYYIDTGVVKVITEPGKEIRIYDETKSFEENPIGSEFVLGNGHPINPKLLLLQNGATFVGLGAQTIDGHKCLKIETFVPDQKAQVFLYAAEDLKYLIIAAQVLNPPRGSFQRLQNISLDVPLTLIEIPPNYQPLAKHKWLRIDSANVSFDDKPAKDFSVFRSDDNQLFVTLYEPHPNTGLPLPWHYLVFLKDQTVEIAFQGTLITSDGKLAWDSDAREAFSNGENKPDKKHYPCDGIKCPKTIVRANSVQFPSVYFDDRKSIVRVSW
jgi:hypothetical protein